MYISKDQREVLESLCLLSTRPYKILQRKIFQNMLTSLRTHSVLTAPKHSWTTRVALILVDSSTTPRDTIVSVPLDPDNELSMPKRYKRKKYCIVENECVQLDNHKPPSFHLFKKKNVCSHASPYCGDLSRGCYCFHFRIIQLKCFTFHLVPSV